jgi:hypothetical protein
MMQFGGWEDIILKMEEASYSEILIPIHETTIRCHDPEDHNINPIGYVVSILQIRIHLSIPVLGTHVRDLTLPAVMCSC